LSNVQLDHNPKQPTDEELLAGSRSGDMRAFAELVRRYESRVASTVIGMLGKCDEAEDVGQETFIRFYNALENFRGDSAIGTYITRIAINLSLNELKRRKRNESKYRRLDQVSEKEGAVDERTDHLFEYRDVVHNALDSLHPKYKSVVMLRLIEGYSTEETATILQLPLGTVLSRLQRAQEKLRKLLHHYKEDT
jgi:RNA polymerase sigma-70 factor, ECF subfamily